MSVSATGRRSRCPSRGKDRSEGEEARHGDSMKCEASGNEAGERGRGQAVVRALSVASNRNSIHSSSSKRECLEGNWSNS